MEKQMKMNEQKIKSRLKELGLEIGEVYHETWDREANMGYWYLVPERWAKEEFGGNSELGEGPEFVIDHGKEGVLGVEIFHPGSRGYIDPETKTFGFDNKNDADNQEFNT